MTQGNHKGRTGVFIPTEFTFTCKDGTVITWVGRGRLPLEAKNRLKSPDDGIKLAEALKAHRKVKPSTGRPRGRPKGFKVKAKNDSSVDEAKLKIVKANEKTEEVVKETIATFS